MNDYSAEIITELWQRTAAVAVAAMLIAGLLYVVKPASARIHRLLWCLVLLQGWLILQYQVPILWFEPPRFVETEDAVIASEFPVVEINSSPLEKETVELVLENDQSTNSFPATMPVAAMEPGTQKANLSKSPVTVASPAPPSWPAVLVGVWIMGMLLIVSRWLFSYFRFVRSISTTERPDDQLQLRWYELLKTRGVKQTIDLRMTDSLGPMLCRLPRGFTLFLPAPFWNGLSELEQTVVLEHELAHYLRRDVWKSLFVRLLALLHWFNPCAWWAVRRFDQCAEWACDATAQHLEPEQRISYAKTLMRLVEQAGSAQPCRPTLCGSSILFRVKRLLSPQPPEDTKMKKMVLCSLVLLLIAFSLIRPQLVAQTPVSTDTTEIAQTAELQSGDTAIVRLPENRSTAQAKKQQAVPREKLRYDGKSFEEWKELLETELKPERRAEAMKALGAFGANGYSKEAAQAIIKITGRYNFQRITNDPVGQLKKASMAAFGQLISPESMKILIKELRSGDIKKQRFGIAVLRQIHSDRDSQELRKHFHLAIPALLELTEGRNQEMRLDAISRIRSIDPKAKGFVPRLRQLMSDKDNVVSYNACVYLVELAPETEGLAKKLVQLARDHNWIALSPLRQLGPKAKTVLPDLIAMIEHPRSSNALPEALGAIGEDALNALIKEYKKSDKPRKQKILAIFQGMGAKAKPALPFLSQEYLAETDQELKLDFTNAFTGIIKDKIERQRFYIKIREEVKKSRRLKKSREEKKKAQDRELDGVGVPINIILR